MILSNGFGSNVVALPTEGVDRNIAEAVARGRISVALPTEGVDRNLLFFSLCTKDFNVALPTEGVDRNSHNSVPMETCGNKVALPTEGVDRNLPVKYLVKSAGESPSPRRAWIEIAIALLRRSDADDVALPTEGVDRNPKRCTRNRFGTSVALPTEGVDRNDADLVGVQMLRKSPSPRRAWIEITASPSTPLSLMVALPTEGVDRNQLSLLAMKSRLASPSPRRAWIEITPITMTSVDLASPSPRRAWIEILAGDLAAVVGGGRPPHGGRG